MRAITGKTRIAILAGLYFLVLWGSGLVALLLRFDFDIPAEYLPYARYWTIVVLVKLVLLAWWGQFSGLLSYFSIPDFRRVVLSMSVAAAALLILRVTLPRNLFAPPRGVILSDFVLSVGAMTLVRLGFRMIRESASDGGTPAHTRRVAIVGAGDVGARLALELGSRRGLGLKPVAFFDDDPTKQGSHVHGIPVLGPPERMRADKDRLDIDRIIIAMPSASAARVGEVLRIAMAVGVRCEKVPSTAQLASGRVRVTQLREVAIEDLLGRDPVKLDMDNIRGLVARRVVMVTGAGGSIGSELCRQIASLAPARLLLVDQSEVQLFPIEQELVELGHGTTILPLVADILDEVRIRGIFAKYRPEVVFHAAAHKHVPMMEGQPSEAVKNNSFGTAGLARIALEHNTSRFVLISTDKAINPTSVMGATKRLAEMYVQALHAANSDRTMFMAVRFGNVLGSSGSVVPIFRKQIATGGPVRVTHPEVTRYFMTIPEAVGLVLQTAVLGSGGEVFVLDMGEPVKIVDLARQLIELSGFRPEIDIAIEFTGLRPGEKMFEELSLDREKVTPTAHPKVMRFVTEPKPLAEVNAIFERLRPRLTSDDPSEVKRLLHDAVPEYRPFLG